MVFKKVSMPKYLVAASVIFGQLASYHMTAREKFSFFNFVHFSSRSLSFALSLTYYTSLIAADFEGGKIKLNLIVLIIIHYPSDFWIIKVCNNVLK